MNSCLGGTREGKSTLMCFSVGRLGRMSLITVGMKEEQKIRVITEFRVERGKTRVEEGRTRV
jgi:hypothetical protein